MDPGFFYVVEPHCILPRKSKNNKTTDNIIFGIYSDFISLMSLQNNENYFNFNQLFSASNFNRNLSLFVVFFLICSFVSDLVHFFLLICQIHVKFIRISISKQNITKSIKTNWRLVT